MARSVTDAVLLAAAAVAAAVRPVENAEAGAAAAGFGAARAAFHKRPLGARRSIGSNQRAPGAAVLVLRAAAEALVAVPDIGTAAAWFLAATILGAVDPEARMPAAVAPADAAAADDAPPAAVDAADFSGQRSAVTAADWDLVPVVGRTAMMVAGVAGAAAAAAADWDPVPVVDHTAAMVAAVAAVAAGTVVAAVAAVRAAAGTVVVQRIVPHAVAPASMRHSSAAIPLAAAHASLVVVAIGSIGPPAVRAAVLVPVRRRI